MKRLISSIAAGVLAAGTLLAFTPPAQAVVTPGATLVALYPDGVVLDVICPESTYGDASIEVREVYGTRLYGTDQFFCNNFPADNPTPQRFNINFDQGFFIAGETHSISVTLRGLVGQNWNSYDDEFYNTTVANRPGTQPTVDPAAELPGYNLTETWYRDYAVAWVGKVATLKNGGKNPALPVAFSCPRGKAYTLDGSIAELVPLRLQPMLDGDQGINAELETPVKGTCTGSVQKVTLNLVTQGTYWESGCRGYNGENVCWPAGGGLYPIHPVGGARGEVGFLVSGDDFSAGYTAYAAGASTSGPYIDFAAEDPMVPPPPDPPKPPGTPDPPKPPTTPTPPTPPTTPTPPKPPTTPAPPTPPTPGTGTPGPSHTAKPGVPTRVKAKAKVRKAIILWSTAASNGARIDKYQVRRFNAGNKTVGANVRSVLFKRLKPGLTYTFYVRAHNKNGWGPWSKTVQARPRS